MTVDQVFIIKKLQNLDEMLVAYSAVTRMPFAICDDESFNDQVWIFTDQDKLKTFAEKYKEEKKSKKKKSDKKKKGKDNEKEKKKSKKVIKMPKRVIKKKGCISIQKRIDHKKELIERAKKTKKNIKIRIRKETEKKDSLNAFYNKNDQEVAYQGQLITPLTKLNEKDKEMRDDLVYMRAILNP